MANMPENADQITDAWLTEVLRNHGTLTHAVVSGHSIEPVKYQVGSAAILRITLDYDQHEESTPRTLIAKLVATQQTDTQKSQAASLREASFYRYLGAEPGIPIPACYHAQVDEPSGVGILLLEDMGACRVGTLDGCPEDVELAVRHLARFHARWWNSERLDEMPWLFHTVGAGAEPVLDELRNTLADALARVQEVFGERLPKTLEQVAERMLSLDQLGFSNGTFTLVHGDYHPGQIFFPSGNAGRFAVFDWEAVHVGSGGEDLASLLATGLTIDQRVRCEGRMVSLYCEIIGQHGVTGYKLEHCWRDVRQGLLYSVWRNAIAAARVDPHLLEEAPAHAVDWLVDLLLERLSAALRAHDVLKGMPTGGSAQGRQD
jgi:aminoglycoside/choline kinase family phosphotransferase